MKEGGGRGREGERERGGEGEREGGKRLDNDGHYMYILHLDVQYCSILKMQYNNVLLQISVCAKI